jgi:uncharacterized protein (TIGR02217 family)
MAFLDVLFPTRISINAQARPLFLTSKAWVGRRRVVNLQEPFPLQQYQIDAPVRSAKDFEALRSFFYVVRGDRDGFRFKDWTDYLLTQQNSRLVRVSAGLFQVHRVYAVGASEMLRPLSRPVAGMRFWRTRASVVTEVTGSATLNTSTGRVTISGDDPADTYTASGQFHVPVAFKDPQPTWRFVSGREMQTDWPSIELEEFDETA